MSLTTSRTTEKTCPAVLPCFMSSLDYSDRDRGGANLSIPAENGILIMLEYVYESLM